MKQKLLGFLFVSILSLWCGAAYANINGELKFKRLSVDEGLSQSTVYAIAQDRQGNIWMGTADGLNCYDGYSFTVYRHIPGDAESLGNNTVNALYVDGQGTIWIGTPSGLSCYEQREGRFVNFKIPGHSMRVFDIVETADQRQLLLGTGMGIVIFDRETRTLETKPYLTGINAQTLCSFRDGILIGTSEGLYNYSMTYGTLVRVLPQLDKLNVASIVYQPGKGCWIGTHGGGLYLTDMELQITRHYTAANSGAKGLYSDNIRVLKNDGKGRLWIGTFDGLFIYDTAKDRFFPFRFIDDEHTSLTHNSIRSIFMDDQGGMWLGTYYGGASYYHPLAFRFRTIQHHLSRNSLSDNTVSCIVEEGATGNLWIGTNDGGLNYYDIGNDRFTLYAAREGRSDALGSNNIKCVYPDRAGNIWIGTHGGGLSRMNAATRAIRTYSLATDQPTNNSCYTIVEKDDVTLWIGTLNGLATFDRHTGRFGEHPLAARNPHLASAIINMLFFDSRSNLWIATENGVFVWNPATDELRSFEQIWSCLDDPSQQVQVMCITEDSQGRIWLGTKQGLYRYEPKTDSFENYTVADGLPNDFVYGILEDGIGRLWLGTNKGLSCFDPLSLTFRNYTTADGISSNQFNMYAYCKTRNGVFFFGGINGITWFRSHNLVDNPFSPGPRITGLTLLGEPLAPGNRTRYTYDEQGRLTGVRFPSKMNLFTVRFVTTNLLAGDRNEFSYTLEGFHTQWYNTRNTEASYSNLSPGHYTFRLRSANNDGRWSDDEAVFNIHILPMWYQTALARLLYVLLAAAVVVLLVRFYSSRAKMRVQLYIERMQARKNEEIGQERIRYYINMAHELRTPLTLILSPLEEIRAHGITDQYVRKRFDYIFDNGTKLLHIVNQLLEFRKAELGMIRLKVAPADVESVVGTILSMFEDNARNRDMDYIMNSSLSRKLYPLDRSYVEVIMTNLLSNAFKFTPNGGMIKVELRERDERLELVVRDSGIGIDRDKQEKIFERFYRVDESYAGTGLGLSIVKRLVELHHGEISIESEPGRFTQFTVSLPVSADAYSPEEIAPDGEKAETTIRDVSLFYEDRREVENCAGEEEPVDGDKDQTILIVEDNLPLKEYLAGNFRDDFNVYLASEGEEALAMLKHIEPDIIITDIAMQGMDGLKFTRAVKQNLRTSHIPVIILTAKDGFDDQMVGIESGADDYIFKPFSISLLNAKITNLIKSRHRLRHHYTNNADIDPDKVTSNSMDSEFLKKAIDVVEKNLDNEEFSSNDFARELCMSRSSLHLKMKSITGESSTQFIRKIRFNQACKLLQDGRYSVAEISGMVGFNSPSYFATSFKKHVGCLPTEYAKTKR